METELLERIARAIEAGEFIVSRKHKARTVTKSVAAAGQQIAFGLPNLKGVAAWWIVLFNESTAPSGTDTRAYFAINDERDKATILAALVAGNGLYVNPGQAFEFDIAEDTQSEEPVVFTVRGVVVTAGPAYAEGAVKVTIAAFPMVRAKRD